MGGNSGGPLHVLQEMDRQKRAHFEQLQNEHGQKQRRWTAIDYYGAIYRSGLPLVLVRVSSDASPP